MFAESSENFEKLLTSVIMKRFSLLSNKIAYSRISTLDSALLKPLKYGSHYK